MKIIGITGTSGSGKTTLSKILNEEKNVEVIDADQVAKQMSVSGSQYLNAIKNTFGKEILLDDGSLNRKLLANKIYNDNSARIALNELTFDYVLNEIKNRISSVDSAKIDIVVIDAPLLIESGLKDICDYVLVLIADEELKIERICQRDNIDYKTAKKRLSIQQNDDYYISNADFVVYNKRNYDLKKEIESIFELITK